MKRKLRIVITPGTDTLVWGTWRSPAVQVKFDRKQFSSLFKITLPTGSNWKQCILEAEVNVTKLEYE